MALSTGTFAVMRAGVRWPLAAGSRRPVLRVALAVAVLLGVYRIWDTYRVWGLFLGAGYDFGLYYAQVQALWSGDPTGIYRTEVLDHFQQQLSVFSKQPGYRILTGPVPYPPLFAWLFTPFALPSPPVGYALWTGLNALLLGYLALRAATLFPVRDRLQVALVVLALPAAWTALYVGQPMILLAIAMGEFYLALRAGKDFRAGLWLSCLLIKPYYGILIGPFLIWKRRWWAVAGVAAGAAVIVLGSIAVAGLPTLLAYPSALADYQSFRGKPGTLILPEIMINWRSLVIAALPGITENRGFALTMALSGLTVLVVGVALRGRWRAAQAGWLPKAMVAALLATLLVSYHSHEYGMVLLVVPLASMLAEAELSPQVRKFLFATILAVVFCVPLAQLTRLVGISFSPPLSQIEMLIVLASLSALVWEVWRERRWQKLRAAP